MSNIGKHMAALVPGIASAASERERVVGDIKLQTANMLRAFGRERRAMVKTLKSELVADRVSRSVEVLAIRDNASEMSHGFRQDHALMRHSLRQSLVESREAVGGSVASLFIAFSKERTEFFKAHHRMGKAQCAGLTKDRRDRSHAVAELMRSFTRAHRHMARVQWASLAKGRRDRSQTVAELMQGFHVSRLVKRPAAYIPAPITALRREAVKPLPETAESLVKPPWPSTPPLGEPVKLVSKKAQKKATPGKAVRHIVKPSKPKKK